ncbi:CAP domain-containing protein [Methylobacterium soli]|uniref:CAP domain-containing protein n=1 Tax=Methylobacterium soli TaxID=553447 RepID=A0A6L3T1J3_9HYPH|nr:CAP domain-containing protein [Methylobacterium soli]KAB1079664.1 CAP domain-containing protein [Methylobacterium soli]
MAPPSPRSALRAAAAALVLALAGCGSPGLLPDAGVPTLDVILDETAAAVAISAYRVQHGLSPVVVDRGLVKAAAYQAGTNARAGRLSHEIGGSFTSRMAQVGLGRAYAAENLSAGSETFDQVLARWKASPEHNRNMLIPQIRRIGIARVDAPGTRYKRYWALVLGG